MKDRVKVVVTGAAGQIGYSLIPRLIDGHTFKDKIVDLELVEIPQVVDKLEGLVMELEDSNFPNMGDVNFSSDFETAAKNADWFLLVGSIPRGIVYNGKKIEERSDLLQINGGIFIEQGKTIGQYGKSNAKILVIGNPANTNALIGRNAANNNSQLWMAMTMLDSSRARSILSKKLNSDIANISRMIIWGNHSPTMYPDYENILVNGASTFIGKDAIDDMDWINNEFLPTVQQRGKAVIDARGASSATSAAKAVLDTVIACENPTALGDCFSAAVITDGSYDIPEGIICGMPLMTLADGSVEIVRDLSLSDFAEEKIKISTDELIKEKSAVKDLLK